MKHHSELLNLIAATIGAKTYLEIGVFNPAHNFDTIEVAHKFGVDPDPKAAANCRMTSDEFFEFARASKMEIDLAWIDGLHHADQVAKDCYNCWEILRPGGVMGIHDSNPHSEHITHVPRDSREWCGDVYKTVSNIMGVPKFTVDFDYGCCVIRKAFKEENLFIRNTEIEWDDFNKMRRQYLNLVTLTDAITRIKSWQEA
jgi:hypothetical protein